MLCACGCLFGLLAGFLPRIALGFVWIFTDYVSRAFEGFLLPFLGLIFLPYTTLFYVLAYHPATGLSTWGIFFVVFGFILDVMTYSGNAYRHRQTISDVNNASPTEAVVVVKEAATGTSSSNSQGSSKK